MLINNMFALLFFTSYAVSMSSFLEGTQHLHDITSCPTLARHIIGSVSD